MARTMFILKKAEQIKKQGNIEWTDLRRTTRTIQCKSCLRHVPEGMLKCFGGYIIVLTLVYKNEINERSMKLCQASWKVRMYSLGFKHGPQKCKKRPLESEKALAWCEKASRQKQTKLDHYLG